MHTTDSGRSARTVHRYRDAFDSQPVSAAIAPRGKELSVGDTVAAARRFFACHPVTVLPVLHGQAYVGVVTEGAIGEETDGSLPILPFVSDALPTSTCDTPAPDALAALDRHGARRLVVLAEDNSTYVGLVCMRGDRRRLCVLAGPLDHPAGPAANGRPT